MLQGRKTNKTKNQQYHSSKTLSNMAALPQVSLKTKARGSPKQRLMSKMLLLKIRTKKRTSNDQTQCLCNTVYSLSVKTGPRECSVIILSLARLQRAPLTKSRNQEECELRWRNFVMASLSPSSVHKSSLPLDSPKLLFCE